MKKKIAILGSTGSIGTKLLEIIEKDIKNFNITLLTAKKNYKIILKQANKFNVKNIIITDTEAFKIARFKNRNKKIIIHNNFKNLDVIFKKKIDYVMSSIIGLEGLLPTINIIKHTKKIAIANKEPIICAWNLIKKELSKFKTDFIPVDSEHFSIWYALKNIPTPNIEKIYLTASGGPLLSISRKKFDSLKISQILKHPNWKMGKKITVDSSTMMNKVFEVIEAKKIFNIPYKKISILVHPKSYLHAILKFKDGMIKIIAHDTTMEIPIFNTLYSNSLKGLNSNNLNINNLNNLNITNVDKKKFPIVKILSELPEMNSLYETVIVSANDELVYQFLNKKIKYTDINKILVKLLNKKEFIILKKKTPKSISQILKLNKLVRFQINAMGV